MTYSTQYLPRLGAWINDLDIYLFIYDSRVIRLRYFFIPFIPFRRQPTLVAFDDKGVKFAHNDKFDSYAHIKARPGFDVGGLISLDDYDTPNDVSTLFVHFIHPCKRQPRSISISYVLFHAL